MSGQSAKPVPTSYLPTLACFLLACLLIGHFLTLGWGGLLANTSSDSGDQGAFLKLGMAIREGRALTDGNRHPLFPLLIAPFAVRDWPYFTTAKLLSLGAGGLALFAIYFLGGRLYGRRAALLTLALLNLNRELLDQTPQVLCEALLVLTFFTAWYAMVRALERPASVKTGAVAGVLVGLAYLTKGTGQLLTAAFLLTALFLYQAQVVRQPGVWAFLGGYVLIVSPLLVYNTARYSNPFYNFNTTHAIWLDDWEERYAASTELPTVLDYLRTHSLGQIVTRQGRGMIAILPVMAECLLPGPRERLLALLREGWLWPILAGTVVALALTRRDVSAYLRAHRHRTLATAIMVGMFYPIYAWFAPVSLVVRYSLPLVPILYLMASRGLVGLTDWAKVHIQLPAHWKERGGLVLGALLWASVGGWTAVDGWRVFRPLDPYASDRAANQAAGAVVSWLNDRAGQQGINVLWGPSHTLPKWMFLPQVERQPIPSDLEHWEQLEDFIAREGFHYIVLDRKMYKRRESLLSQSLDKNGATILFQQIPPGWTFAFAQEGGIINPEWGEVNWYIVELTDPHTPARVTPIPPLRFGEAIQLIGYDLERTEVHAGEWIEVTLAWKATERPSEDYTVFVHLLDESGQRWAQVDRFPLGGMYPTSWWKVGMEIVDQYRVYLDPKTPPGEYSIVVGMYHPWTRVRLPATTADGRALFQEQISLPASLKVELDHLFTIPSIQHPQKAQLGPSIRLLGYDVSRTRVTSGGMLSLTLYWQAQGPTHTSYTVFTHLISDKGEIWGQWDNIPAVGNRPTTEWLTDEVIVDRYTIPLQKGAPPGDYRIEVGMYDANTGQRLPVFHEASRRVVSDRVLLDTPIRVESFGFGNL